MAKLYLTYIVDVLVSENKRKKLFKNWKLEKLWQLAIVREWNPLNEVQSLCKDKLFLRAAEEPF